jgi:uncharacterized membrane protein
MKVYGTKWLEAEINAGVILKILREVFLEFTFKSYLIDVKKPGYREQEISVSVPDGERTELKVELEKAQRRNGATAKWLNGRNQTKITMKK